MLFVESQIELALQLLNNGLVDLGSIQRDAVHQHNGEELNAVVYSSCQILLMDEEFEAGIK